MAEKDKLLRDMDQCKSQLCSGPKDSALDTSSMYDNRSSYIEEIKVNNLHFFPQSKLNCDLTQYSSSDYSRVTILAKRSIETATKVFMDIL